MKNLSIGGLLGSQYSIFLCLCIRDKDLVYIPLMPITQTKLYL